eukprot:6198397-Pleurochrysis_carterae.AAC.1
MAVREQASSVVKFYRDHSDEVKHLTTGVTADAHNLTRPSNSCLLRLFVRNTNGVFAAAAARLCVLCSLSVGASETR